jgi:hypothetical protein
MGLALAVCSGTAANGQENRDGMHWIVSYDFNEHMGHFKMGARTHGAIRLSIHGNYPHYHGTLWLYRALDADHNQTSYELIGTTRDVALSLEGHHNRRQRIAFWSDSVPLYQSTTNNTILENVVINGIWQPGRNMTNADSHRIQLKVHRNAPPPGTEPAPSSGDCEDDPDTDVLEEDTAPPDDTPPPTDP